PPGANSLSASTVYGASGDERGNALALGNSGDVWITGSTTSSGLPLANAVDSSYNGSGDVFFAGFNSALTTLSYASFVGGSSAEEGRGIAFIPGSGGGPGGLGGVGVGQPGIGVADHILVAGWTASSGFPTTSGVWQTTLGGGHDGFVFAF